MPTGKHPLLGRVERNTHGLTERPGVYVLVHPKPPHRSIVVSVEEVLDGRLLASCYALLGHTDELPFETVAKLVAEYEAEYVKFHVTKAEHDAFEKMMLETSVEPDPE